MDPRAFYEIYVVLRLIQLNHLYRVQKNYSTALLGECFGSINLQFINSENSKPLVGKEGFEFQFQQILKNDMFSDGYDVIKTVSDS